MQTKVNVCADDMGNVINQSKNNPEYGYIRLQQDRVTFGNNGWVKKQKLSTLLQGKVEDLQSLNFNAGDTIAGKIVIKEQLEPFNNNDPGKQRLQLIQQLKMFYWLILMVKTSKMQMDLHQVLNLTV